MGKLRVYQLARELNRDNGEVIRELQHLGAPVTSHSNTVEDRMAEQLRNTLGVLVIEKPKKKTKAKKVKGETVKAAKTKVQPDEKKPEKIRPEPKLVKAKPKPVEPVEAPQTSVTAEKLPEPAEVEAESPKTQSTPVVAAASSVRTKEVPASAEVESKAPLAHKTASPARPVEARKTMQQLAQERLRQQNRPVPTPGRRPVPTRDGRSAPVRPGQGGSVPPRPRGPSPPRFDQRRDRPRPTRAQRVARTMERRPLPQPKAEVEREFRRVTLTENLTVKDLAEKLETLSKEVIKKLMDRGMFATINQTLDKELAVELCKDFNAEADFVTFEESAMLDAVEVSEPEKMETRPPVITIMGHVDHGKTSLLDAIRETHVTDSEHGGITQHIGAYQVQVGNRKLTFLDTPGHEAFTLMRARGASVTDVVILVVAADDGVMPQTLESISHTKAAKVPLLVAINKIDVPNANVEKVKRELAEKEVLAEDWGGDTVMVEVSAKQKTNLELLLEMIFLVVDMRQLKGDPNFPAMGTALEAKLDKGRGNVATMLVQNGTLKVGDHFIVGAVYGKVRAMYDENGNQVESAGPSVPVEVLGLQGLPMAGDSFQVITDDTKARKIALFRQEQLRDIALAKKSRLTLDQLHVRMEKGEAKDVPIVLKGDVQGSTEVLSEMLNKLETAKVKILIIHSAVGAITEYDVLLAATSNAIIVGFNVRPEKKAAEIAAHENVDIRLHTVIYNVVDEIKQAMVGVLDPITKETYMGTAEIRDTFRVPKIGTIAGSYVTDGRLARNAQVRLLRDNIVIFEGKIGSLKRFKEDAAEVRSGYECGIGLQGYNDVKVGDVIEAFSTEQVAAEIGT
jgi:translation initiation factor IF-2